MRVKAAATVTNPAGRNRCAPVVKHLLEPHILLGQPDVLFPKHLKLLCRVRSFTGYPVADAAADCGSVPATHVQEAVGRPPDDVGEIPTSS